MREVFLHQHANVDVRILIDGAPATTAAISGETNMIIADLATGAADFNPTAFVRSRSQA